MEKYMKFLGAMAALIISTTAALAENPRIRALGSSTVYPFATIVAEKFGKDGHQTPVIESTGTGGGIKIFCSGAGLDTPSIVNASRAIKDTEVEACATNGVSTPAEFKFGYDAIVLAHAKGYELNITTRQIYLALAKSVIIDGEVVPNPYVKWSDIDGALPALKIEVLGPPPTSGTRDSFVELVLEKECKALIKEYDLKISEEEQKSICKSMREDGAFIEAGENDNLIVQKLQANPNAVGIFGFSFLEENSRELVGAVVNGVNPDFDSIAAGDYPISRGLYFYVKKEHVSSSPELKAFVEEFISEGALGEEGYLTERGLIPLHEDELKKAIEAAKNL
jgi:phosphate transport system substrate-binding protein